jgi:hypothetical protein
MEQFKRLENYTFIDTRICIVMYTEVGKGRFTVVCMEKDMQVMIITVALLTQKNATMAQCT